MTYTLPPKLPIDKHTPTGIVIYGYTAEQMSAAYEQGLEDAAGVLTKLITMAPTFNEAFAFSLVQETIRAMKGTL